MDTSIKPPAAVLLRSLLSLLVMLAVMGVLLFWPAGILSWGRGWWFAGAFLVAILISIAVLWRVNPEIFAARSGVAKGTKGWDYAIVAIVVTGFLAVLPVAGLDDGRFHWFPLPDWVVVVGYVIFLAGYAIQTWSQAVNRHFEPGVRIQTDRGHKVIDTGPYASVRHPGYISGSMLVFGTALALGSLYALIPAAIVIATLVVRTLIEERALYAGLPGYTEYTQRIRYRWLPGVW